MATQSSVLLHCSYFLVIISQINTKTVSNMETKSLYLSSCSKSPVRWMAEGQGIGMTEEVPWENLDFGSTKSHSKSSAIYPKYFLIPVVSPLANSLPCSYAWPSWCSRAGVYIGWAPAGVRESHWQVLAAKTLTVCLGELHQVLGGWVALGPCMLLGKLLLNWQVPWHICTGTSLLRGTLEKCHRQESRKCFAEQR